MAAPFHPAVVAARKEERLAFLMTPWVDKAVAAIALVPFICLIYVRFRAFGVDLPLRGGCYSFCWCSSLPGSRATRRCESAQIRGAC